jgi:hypothetical protein
VKILFFAGLGIKREEMHGILLALRPKAFPADIGSHGRQQFKAETGERGLKQNDRDKRQHKPQQATLGKRASLHSDALVHPSGPRRGTRHRFLFDPRFGIVVLCRLLRQLF